MTKYMTASHVIVEILDKYSTFIIEIDAGSVYNTTLS